MNAVEIRGVNETAWKLLKDKVREKYISWDSTAFPDGEYRVRVSLRGQRRAVLSPRSFTLVRR